MTKARKHEVSNYEITNCKITKWVQLSVEAGVVVLEAGHVVWRDRKRAGRTGNRLHG